MRLEVQRPELVHTEDRLWLAGLGDDLTVGDRIQVLDAGFPHRIIGSVEVFQVSGEPHLRNRGHVHALGGQQHH
ncbi:MAG: hypothetical protein J2P30_07895, partial [Actinobacteria bacterium]|nr:hypothetical protein [Actinomycetota bacterium]